MQFKRDILDAIGGIEQIGGDGEASPAIKYLARQSFTVENGEWYSYGLYFQVTTMRVLP